ncbi:MAG: nuclease-related domain-containing protein [Planctomycetota bacterium]
MAKIMSRQTTLKAAFWLKSTTGLLLTIAGIFLVSYSAIQHSRDIPVAIIGVIIAGAGITLIARNKSFLIGAKGEEMVSRALAGFPDDWYIFNDVFIQDTQIDHILICPKGVYAIETKHYRGTITGNTESPDWWQFIRLRQTKIYNPVRQAVHHSAALANYLRELDYNQPWVEPVVVFSHPDVKLDVVSTQTPVIRLSQLKEFLDNRAIIISPLECAEISDRLNNYIAGNKKKNILPAQWLTISLLIMAILGGIWWITSEYSATNEIPRENVIPWQDASRYLNREITVQGRIARTHSGDKAWEMNFDDNYKTTLTLVIFAGHFNNFPNGIDKYRNKLIRLRGKIELNDYKDYNRPQLIIEHPKQIEVLD